VWTPWRDKIGFAKATAILATILSIATFSCGVNWILVFSSFSSYSSAIFNWILVLGWIEFGVFVICLAGILFMPAIRFLIKALRKDRMETSSEDSNDR
jgi:hypothetical protein